MKITSKQYALVLGDVLEGKNKDAAEAVIKKFISLLVKNNDTRKINDIIKYFSVNRDKQAGLVKTEVTSARTLSADNVKSLEKYIKEISGATNLDWSEKIDSNLLGGVVIKYGDRVIDASVKNEIIQLKNYLIK